MLDYYSSRDAHISQARTQLLERYPNAVREFPNFQRASESAYAMAIHWIAEFAAANPQWVAQLKQVAKQPLVEAIVVRLGLTGFEVSLANVFVGLLIDVAFASFIHWEANRDRTQEMFQGGLSDTFNRWAREVGPQ